MNKKEVKKDDDDLYFKHSDLQHKQEKYGELHQHPHKEETEGIKGPSHVKSSSDKTERGIESHEVYNNPMLK
jgi:hypothetical protein